MSKDEPGIKIVKTKEKGRGIHTMRSFEKGEFIVEYRGDMISSNEAYDREAKYAEDPAAGCYMYFFVHAAKNYWYVGALP